MTYTTDPDNDNFQLNRLINAFKQNQVDGTQGYQDRNAYDKMVNWRLPVNNTGISLMGAAIPAVRQLAQPYIDGISAAIQPLSNTPNMQTTMRDGKPLQVETMNNYMNSGTAFNDYQFNPDAFMQSKLRVDPKTGVYSADDPLAQSFLMIESRGNPNAKSSTGAKGLYQFTHGTGKTFGLLTDEDFYDPQKNFDAYKRLTVSNAKEIQRAGLPVNPVTLYGWHNLGPRFAEVYRAFQRGDDNVSAKTREYMRLNGAKSVQQYMDTFSNRIQRFWG
jgi:hypothetical protein